MRRGRGHVVKRQLDQLGVPEHAYDGIVSSGDVTRGVMLSRPGQSSLSHRARTRSAAVQGSRCAFRYRRDRGLRRLHRPLRRRNRNAGKLSRDASPSCARAICSCCAPIPISWSSAARSSSIAPARLPISIIRSAARCSMPASRIRRSIRRRCAAPRRCAAYRGEAKAGTIAIGDSIRTDMKGAAPFGVDSIFVTDGIHAEELGGASCAGSSRHLARVCARGCCADGGDAKAGLVAALKPRGSFRSGGAAFAR